MRFLTVDNCKDTLPESQGGTCVAAPRDATPQDIQKLGRGNLGGTTVALKAGDFLRIDLEAQSKHLSSRLMAHGQHYEPRAMSYELRVRRFRTTSAIRAMWAGVLPQQAPTMLAPPSMMAG